LCTIVDNPSKFAGLLVTLVSQYESDGIERAVLVDSSCAGRGIAITAPARFAGKDQLEDALHVGLPGTMDKVISGTFTGRFAWYPGKNPSRVLAIREVYGVSSHKRLSQ
jgi:hypothetical protein